MFFACNFAYISLKRLRLGGVIWQSALRLNFQKELPAEEINENTMREADSIDLRKILPVRNTEEFVCRYKLQVHREVLLAQEMDMIVIIQCGAEEFEDADFNFDPETVRMFVLAVAIEKLIIASNEFA